MKGTKRSMFDTIVIVGVGLIGGSFGLAVRRAFPGTRIIGVSSGAAVARALEVGAVTEGCGYEELVNVVPNADLVVLCTPINRIQGLLSLIAPHLRDGVLVTDVGSTKRSITAHATSTLPSGIHFIGGHPMTGSEKRGIDAADPFLFQNAIYVLCPTDTAPLREVERLSGFLGHIGASVVILNAELHDKITAAVSHLPQLLAVALVEYVGSLSVPDAPYLQLAAGGFRDMTRIASSPFSVWDDIFRTNDAAIRAAIDMFIDRLKLLRDRVGDPSLGGDFEIANVTRASIPRDTKGFMRTLYEVLVVVEDKTGVIAAIAGELAAADINIKDIEVLKVREGEGGTLRLAFENEDAARQAVDILSRIGCTARMRH
jgi:prephenate dehydrogenase